MCGFRILVFWIVLLSADMLVAMDWAARESEFKKKIEPILASACNDCHSGDEAAGGLALSYFETAKSITKERHTFGKVMARLKIGDMPPADAEPLSDADRKLLLEWLDSLLFDVDCGKSINPGSVTLRRLTKYEYRNTIRDLIGVDYPKAEEFPGDDVGYGFDNIGDVLNMPPLLMEKYIAAAEEISQMAIALPEQGPSISNTYPLERFKIDKGGRVTATEISMYSQAFIEFEENAPWNGVFHLEIVAGGTKAKNSGPEITVSLDDKVVGKRVVTAEAGKDNTLDIPLRMRSGAHKIKIAFTNDEYVELPNGEKQDRNLDIFSIRFYGAKPQPPLNPATLPESHRRIITVTPNAQVSGEEALRKVISPLIVYVYRRPVNKEETERVVQLASNAMEEGESFEGAVQLALQAMLLSPNFLFKVEQPKVAAGEEFPLLDDFELASRISYFLWSSLPDRDLMTLAWKKQLRDPKVLQQTIQRMMADPRAARFVENFAGQWLTLRKLDSFEPNSNLFPTWNREVRSLARQETLTFVYQVFREDLPVVELLDADYTYMNEKLAKFYGVPGIKGEDFQKVSVKSQPRRGLLTHASILAVTSNPTRTSPVKRGKFVLDNILNTPPPPPPPGVPELEKVQLTGTLREQLEQHRADPACAVAIS